MNGHKERNTMKEIKTEEKLKITFRGQLKKFWTLLYLKPKMKIEGVELQEVIELSSKQSAVVLSGDRRKLWKVLKLFKQPSLFMKFDRVVFQFLD
jgi:hypothetical protein